MLGNCRPSERRSALRVRPRLVLGGKRAVWVKYAGVMSREAGIYTAKPGQKKPDDPRPSGCQRVRRHITLTGVAADGEQTIVYGDARGRTNRGTAAPRPHSTTGGDVHRFVASGTRLDIRDALPGIGVCDRRPGSVGSAVAFPLTWSLAGDSRRVRTWRRPPERARRRVQPLRRRLARVVPQGTVRDVALAWPALAVIVGRPDGTTVIERYNAAKGELVGTTTMAGAADLAISSARNRLPGREDDLHDPGGQVRALGLLWRATATPIGLSIEGKRVAWAACGSDQGPNLP